MGRVKFAAKNIAFGYMSNIITALLGFVLQTVLIRQLGKTISGVNGLYTNILTVLSLAELGIGTALNYSLYGPVARGDREKIKSYMLLYRKAYRTIALVVAGVGLAITPFLKYLVKKPGDITERELIIYYLVFLFNTVSTYFVAYKYSLVNAEQKNYIQTNIITVTKVVTTLSQIAVLYIRQDFFLYLITAAAIELLQKIFVSFYLNRRYPYLREKDVRKLSGEETGEVVRKTRALVFHKVGDAARLQTDSLIISSFLEVSLVGVVNNYNLVITSVSNFVNIIFNSVLSSFGNLIATESREKQYQMFKVYRFFASWIYGFSAVGFFILLTPLIRLWATLFGGSNWTLPLSVVGCILLDYYFKGDRIVLMNFKTAAGVFEQDKYLSLIQGAVNLVLSILLVQRVGLIGIYIGTVVSGLIANITKPFIVYKVCFDRKAGEYFADSVKYILMIALALLLCAGIGRVVLREVTVFTFAIMFVIITLVFNGLFLLVFGKTGEFRYLWNLLVRKGKRSV